MMSEAETPKAGRMDDIPAAVLDDRTATRFAGELHLPAVAVANVRTF